MTTAVLGPLLVLSSVGGYLLLGAMGTVTITVKDDYAAFSVDVPVGTGIDFVDHDSVNSGGELVCDHTGYGMNDHGLAVETVAMDCDLPDQRVMNGSHGLYRTLADVPKPRDVAEVDTGLGPAEVFVQDYSESTNFTTDYVEPVAIVTLDDPVRLDYPTLVIRSEQGELDREEFTELVRSLDDPNG